MFNIFIKAKSIILKNKLILVGILILIGIGVYFFWGKGTGATETRSVINTVTKETLVNYVSGTGQVAASSESEIKSKASGDLLSLKIKNGQEVKAGQILAIIDSTDAQKSVRDAESSLENAKLSLEKLTRGDREEELEISQMDIEANKRAITDAENNLAQVKTDAESDLNDIYESALTELSQALNKSTSTMITITDIQYSHFNNNDQDGSNIASTKATAVKTLFGLDDGGRVTSEYFNKANGGVKKLIMTAQLTKSRTDIDDTLSQMKNALQKIKNILEAIPVGSILTSSEKSSVISEKTNMDSLISTITSRQQSIISQINTNTNNIKDAEEKIVDAKSALEKAEKQLALNNSPDPLDIKSLEMSIKEKENSLYDAKNALADYTIRAPFSGVISAVSSEKGSSISANSSIATIISKELTAEITLNEVDIAKVVVGQKATLTFDAISDLTVTGTVSEVDTVGTVSQGVVSYGVKIVFDTEAEGVKPGMSVSVSIITKSSQDALVVPSSAIKTVNNVSYVEVPDETIDSNSIGLATGVLLKNKTKMQEVTAGLSNDTSIEILTGLSEGDLVVVKTVTASSTSKSSTNSVQSLFQMGGGSRSGSNINTNTNTKTNTSK
ncbi:MAG: efflux RND transporter periplasmic adaptor subunit [Candidatus Pacebacteria bacterium]|nr:efflux RND transporter periplasmic adaptor subunit [Candidatus Paceibacterota bacterium]